MGQCFAGFAAVQKPPTAASKITMAETDKKKLATKTEQEEKEDEKEQEEEEKKMAAEKEQERVEGQVAPAEEDEKKLATKEEEEEDEKEQERDEGQVTMAEDEKKLATVECSSEEKQEDEKEQDRDEGQEEQQEEEQEKKHAKHGTASRRKLPASAAAWQEAADKVKAKDTTQPKLTRRSLTLWDGPASYEVQLDTITPADAVHGVEDSSAKLQHFHQVVEETQKRRSERHSGAHSGEHEAPHSSCGSWRWNTELTEKLEKRHWEDDHPLSAVVLELEMVPPADRTKSVVVRINGRGEETYPDVKAALAALSNSRAATAGA